MPIFYLILGACAVLVGYLVAFITGLIVGTKKASRLPGGSIMGGVGVGYTIISQYPFIDGSQSLVIILAGALGLLGWKIYTYLAKKMNQA